VRLAIVPLRVAVVVGLTCVFVLAPRSSRGEPLPDSCLARIREYDEALQSAQRARRPHSLESLHARANRVRNALVRSSDEAFAPIYMLSDQELLALRVHLPTFMIDREIHERAEARQDSMVALARRVGAPADTAYWDRVVSFDSWGVPSYVEPVTDETGCTKFGSGQLVAAYGAWTAYRKRYPGHYAADVDARIEDVTRELLEGTCACGDASGVTSEFQGFIKRFPKDKLTPRVRERLREVRAGRGPMRYHCAPR
jgi:hypothetical protein